MTSLLAKQTHFGLRVQTFSANTAEDLADPFARTDRPIFSTKATNTLSAASDLNVEYLGIFSRKTADAFVQLCVRTVSPERSECGGNIAVTQCTFTSHIALTMMQ